MMTLDVHLEFDRAIVIRPGQPSKQLPLPEPYVQAIYVVMTTGGRVETRGGKYETSYLDDYVPHPDEAEVLESLARMLEGKKLEIRSRPAADPRRVYFEVIRQLPYSFALGELSAGVVEEEVARAA